MGGQMTAGQLARLINTREAGGAINNLHEMAWDEADKLVFKMRLGNGG